MYAKSTRPSAKREVADFYLHETAKILNLFIKILIDIFYQLLLKIYYSKEYLKSFWRLKEIII